MASFLMVALGGRGDRPVDVVWFVLPRVAGIGAAITVAAVLQNEPGGDDIAPAVTAVALAGVSVLASWSLPLGLASVALALSLGLPSRWTGSVAPTLRQGLLQANRQLGHIESVFSWVVLALLLAPLTLQVAAVAVLRCLSGDVSGESWPALPLDQADLSRRIADLYPAGAALDEDAPRRDTLVCLGWAASVLQGRKREGWTFGRALELAFEDSATFGELSVTSSPHDAPTGPLSCR